MDLFNLSYLLMVIVPAVVGIVIIRALESLISSFGKKKGLPPSPIHLMVLIVRWILIIIIIIAVAGIFGVSLGSLWISIAAIVSMVLVGFFAVWSILGNILATIVVMVWRPFQVGDKVA